ncbi:YhcB family protein [Candidatus Blochmanniella camponoti]|uniref:Z-ring associated protein G n=1 Tax=Candidatus Blochmanniella camponoti TaxID=108080 RepID=A0AAE9I5U9_9ENTR|nr:DUF1043 family protein [Candidatus Blochmannia herculeanus]URJ24494.1 YhcB family protein [Candidatus Blochmannia herculeanus]URJ26898.1 YhcB family protein [Candidatus Blochmannia herculeanus]URJ27299.1 YhcB family protein [Candidatus Blochmannia herculeanus]
MIWICIFASLIIGIIIGAFIMYYKARYLLHDQKTLYNELQNKKIKLNEYQKELSNHFIYTIKLLNKIEDDYRHLYHNVKRSANFFLPNTDMQDNIHTFNTKKTTIQNEQLPIEAPLDYSSNTENTIKNHDNK